MKVMISAIGDSDSIVLNCSSRKLFDLFFGSFSGFFLLSA